MENIPYYVSILVIVVLAIVGWVIFKRWQKKKNEIFRPVVSVVPPGWQFFPKLTSGDPPGTIFRITPQKQRIYVGVTKNVPIHQSEEIQGRITQKIEAKTDMLARILSLNIQSNLASSQNEDLVFEMSESVRETTHDEDIDPLINKKFKNLTIRDEDRYFVIRETSATKQITFQLKRDQVDRLGGENIIKANIEGKATVFSKKDATTYELKRKFGQLMRVMFSAEEIQPEKIESRYEELLKAENIFYLIPISKVSKIRPKELLLKANFTETEMYSYSETSSNPQLLPKFAFFDQVLYEERPWSNKLVNLTLQGCAVKDSVGKRGRIEDVELDFLKSGPANLIVRTFGPQASKHSVSFSDLDLETMSFNKAFKKINNESCD
jgi:hypothetical protein